MNIKKKNVGKHFMGVLLQGRIRIGQKRSGNDRIRFQNKDFKSLNTFTFYFTNRKETKDNYF